MALNPSMLVRELASLCPSPLVYMVYNDIVLELAPKHDNATQS
jgi:hypothetical protein